MPQQADIFLVPLLNGAFGVGQIVLRPPQTPDKTAACIFTLRQTNIVGPQSQIHLSEALALVLVDETLLTSKTWPIVGFETLPPVDDAFKLKKAIKTRFDRVAVQDSAVIEAFVNALHGLYPWDGFPDPHFFTKLLIHPDRIPSTSRTKSQLA